MDLSPKARLMRDWLISEWADKLCSILESMADERPTFERRGVASDETEPPPDALIWQQKFATSTEPAVWVGTPIAVSLDLGRRTLAAAGVESTEDADAQNTFLELLAQSLSALGQSIGSHLACEASATDGVQLNSIPDDLEWLPVRFEFANGVIEPIWLCCSPEMMERLAGGAKAATSTSQAAMPVPAENHMTGTEGSGLPGGSASKTFDLLLDVALPVSISFGRTFLPVKEVLKLTTGSIVELDRGINEPVDVIVNNCVIARGEVVVVEGNYGVRILQLASRFDRLRTGSSAVQAQELLAGRPA